jgi:error-prone DNA polymerase
MFCHLHVHSPFSFLDGASPVKALLERASSMGMPAMAITDHDSMAGAMAFRQAAERMGMKAIQGVELTLEGGYHLVLLARDATGYSSISRAITKAHLSSERLKPRASWEDISQVEGVFCLSGCRRGEIPSLILRGKYQKALEAARRYISLFGRENFFLEMEAASLPGSGLLNRGLKEMSSVLGLRLVATANAHYARKEDFPVHDVLTCVRTLTRLEEVHPERRLNAENYLKSPGEMREAVGERSALETAEWIARECQATPELGKRHYPVYGVKEPGRLLEHLVMEGALERYGRIGDRITERLRHELDIIGRLGYEDYFLLVWDIARHAREKRIRYAGRGSAADSAVAYCLRITEVDAIARDLLFERFLSAERAEKPDIDLDFDARYRDDVARYVTERYGGERVAWTCTYNTFRARSALRDMGKAMGYPEGEIDRLAKRMPYLRSDAIKEAMDHYPELGGSHPERYGLLLDICARVSSFPRHIPI